MIGSSNDDDMRPLPSALGNKLMKEDRTSARPLKGHDSAQCNVYWPEQADLLGVILVSVDDERGVVQVRTAPGTPVWSMPPYCVKLA